MADFGIKLVGNGRDINTQDRALIDFTSEYLLFKLDQTGSFSLPVPANATGHYVQTSATQAHGLGYRPVVGAYWSTDNVNWQSCGSRRQDLWTPALATQVSADTTNLTFSVITNTGTGALTIFFRWVSYVDGLNG